jgi:hypothetical protein
MKDGSENNLETLPATGEILTPQLPPPYVKTKDLKKARMSSSGETENENLASSAASLEESLWVEQPGRGSRDCS